MTPKAPPATFVAPEALITDAASARTMAALYRRLVDETAGAEGEMRARFCDILAVAARFQTFAELAAATGNETSYLQREAKKSALYQPGRKDPPPAA